MVPRRIPHRCVWWWFHITSLNPCKASFIGAPSRRRNYNGWPGGFQGTQQDAPLISTGKPPTHFPSVELRPLSYNGYHPTQGGFTSHASSSRPNYNNAPYRPFDITLNSSALSSQEEPLAQSQTTAPPIRPVPSSRTGSAGTRETTGSKRLYMLLLLDAVLHPGSGFPSPALISSLI